MFEKFGEMNLEELNMAAAGFREEGDTEALFALAQENGLDKEDAEDYLDGITSELAEPAAAAWGRVKVWGGEKQKDQGAEAAMQVILTMLMAMLTDQALICAVMEKGKNPKAIYEAMKKSAEKNRSGGMAVVCGTDKQLQDLIRTYFLEPDKLQKKTEEVMKRW